MLGTCTYIYFFWKMIISANIDFSTYMLQGNNVNDVIRFKTIFWMYIGKILCIIYNLYYRYAICKSLSQVDVYQYKFCKQTKQSTNNSL